MGEVKENATQSQEKNEFEFSKTKGFGSLNYGAVYSKAVLNENALSVNSSSKVFFIKGKNKTASIEYGTIGKVEVKTHFSAGDLISAIIVLIISIFAWEYNGIVGLLIVALLVFCSCSKNIVITRTNASKTVIQAGLFQKQDIDAFCAKLKEKMGKGVNR